MNISFSNAFYVLECSLNLISFDQLNDLCSMTYKFEMFIVEDQDIITKKDVNNVFFFELWKHVSYNFIVTFIVDNFAMSSDESKIMINKNILNVWHARLRHLRKQNVRRLVKMSKRMNLIKLIANKNLCESCIVIKQKVESHNNFVVLDKHLLNLKWSYLVQLFVFNDKIKYFVTFLCDFIKRSVIYVLRVKSNTFDAFKHFQQHNEHENNRVRRFRIDWRKEYFSDEFDNYRFEHDIEWKSIVSQTSKQNEVVERLRQIFMSMINIMLKNVDLNDKWWIELIKIINYFRNRSSMTNKLITFFEIDTKRKFSFAHLCRIKTTSYVMKRKSVTKWKKLVFRSFFVVLINYERDHIYRMLRLNESIYRVSSVTWIKKKRKESFFFIFETSTKRSITKSIISSTKRQALKSNSIIILMFSSQFDQSIDVVSFSSVFSTAKVNTSNIESISLISILSALKRHFELRYRLDSFDSLNLLIMKCMKNVIDSQQVLKSRSYKKTMNDSSRKEWVKIMKNENIFFLINEIWTLINFFKDWRVLRDKWVYKIKKEEHDEILRYKTRWMIREFEQIERLDYTRTFVSMIKSMNYKTMYVIIIVNDWKIEQMNVKTTFLYDKIHENVFVVQFTKFEQEINKICKLNKTLYDLKQSSRVWFKTLIKFLFSFDYVSLNVEFNVFMKNDIMIVIYVNDLIFTKFDRAIIFWLKNALNERFEMSDLNLCIYYLDMMIFRNRSLRQLILNQSVYVEQMLRDHEMWNCKSLITLMNVLCRLIKISDEYIADKSLRISYQSIVKSLMYIMLKTRSNITYFISMISRYVFNLIQIHWQAVKRIFRYLRKTH
jgi:phosphoribosylanthranilate isomerase